MNDNNALLPKGVEPDVHRVGGVLILVRGRESPPQAQGNSSNCLKCKLLREVTTFTAMPGGDPSTPEGATWDSSGRHLEEMLR